MKKLSPQRGVQTSQQCFDIQPLEDRRLLSVAPAPGAGWAAFPQMMGYDQIVNQYPFLNGAGQSIAVIDSGVDYHHIALGGAMGRGHIVAWGWNFIDNNADITDNDGHGTGICGLLGSLPYAIDGIYNQGLVPGAKLLMLKQDGAGSIKAALDWVIANRVKYNIQAVNLTDFMSGDHHDNAYDGELATLNAAGVLIATPTGNGGPNKGIIYPAYDPNTIAVGGVDLQGNVYAQTQLGPALDILGPGKGVTLPYYFPEKQPPNDEVFVQGGEGTSWAAAHVTATDVMLKQIEPDITRAQAVQIMQASGVPTAASDGNVYDRLNMLGAVNLAYKTFDDRYQGNTSIATAAPLAFDRYGGISATGLKLLIGKDDYYSFSLRGSTNVTISLSYRGSSALPPTELLDGRGRQVAVIASRGLSTTLPAGTYYVHLSAKQSMAGSYGLNIASTTVGRTSRGRTPRVSRMAIVSKPAGGVFSRTPIASLPGLESAQSLFDEMNWSLEG